MAKSVETTATRAIEIPIPQDLENKLVGWGDRVRRWGARHFHPEERAWRKIGHTRAVQGEHAPTPEQIWDHVISAVIRHQNSPEAQDFEGPQRYEALIFVSNGADPPKLMQKRHQIRVQFDESGEVFVDDDEDGNVPDERNAALREALAISERELQREREARRAAWDETDKRLDAMSKTVIKLAESVPQVFEEARQSQIASAKIMHRAASIFVKAHEKSAEAQRYEVIQEQLRQEASEGEQRRQMGMMAAVAGAPVLLKQMGWSPKEIAELMKQAGPFVAMIAGGGGAGAMPSMPAPAAPKPIAAAPAPAGAWNPGPKPPTDGDDDGRRMDLAIWILSLTEDQEREIRAIIGADHYDRIRAAAAQSDEAAASALKSFWDAASAEGASAVEKAKALHALLGDGPSQMFVQMCQLSSIGA